MLEVYLLYVLPFVCRFGLSSWEDVEWYNVLLSILPVLITLPSMCTTRCIRNMEREHVIRHTYYSIAFTVSIVSSIRWENVQWEGWGIPLITFLIVGALTLWSFVFSHVFENHVDGELRTHQGDVAVLPLTLVAIGTFAFDVPDEAFQFSRSVVFFVPVVVAWATLYFIAYQGFATKRVTTLEESGFKHHSHAALVIASVHLSLLECRATPVLFILFPMIAAFYCQLVPLHTAIPTMRPRWQLLNLLVSGTVATAAGFLSTIRLGIAGGWVVGMGAVIGSLTLPCVVGTRWYGPASAFSTLVTVAYLAERGLVLEPIDYAGVWGTYFLSFFTVHFFARPCA